jgi:SAM-dependent methyltransferase
LRYVGIDPELPRLRAPDGMRLLRRAIEGFDAPPSSFDHVLILRSYNHIRLPSVAFPKLRRWLRPGGRLTVVDGSAYGLVLTRPPGPARPGEFQHFRNHTSRQARALLEDFGFAVVRETPVRPAGCNEWLLELKKKCIRSGPSGISSPQGNFAPPGEGRWLRWRGLSCCK